MRIIIAGALFGLSSFLAFGNGEFRVSAVPILLFLGGIAVCVSYFQRKR